MDKWGGDCIKFAGDAILFCWPVFDLRDLADTARKAVTCSLLVHERIKAHPPIESVKLTLHAGMGCGAITACILGGAR